MSARLVSSRNEGPILPMGACANGNGPVFCHCFNGSVPIGGRCNAGSVIGPPP